MVEMAPGQVVAGWRVERELARGGMGVIYLAQHPRLPRVDVLKVLPSWLAEDDRFRDRFLREVDLVSGLAHPHVIVVHDSGEYEGQLYLAMQYVRGGDLRARVDAGPMPMDQALHIAGQIGSALDAAHRTGIVHRDVKPENVLLADTGPDEPDHAVLTDFGISRDATRPSVLTMTGELLLTPAYAAPEQVAAGPVDGRTDQYALACLLFELLTGTPPYSGGSSLAVLAAHLHQPVRELPSEAGLPPQLGDALRRAMAKRPEDRFPSCRAFIDAAGGTVHARVATPLPLSLPAQPQPPPPTPISTPIPTPIPEAPPPPMNRLTTPDWAGDPPPARGGGRSRRGAVVAGVVLLLAAAGVGGALALRGGDGSAAAGNATASSGAAGASLGSVPTYDALLAHIPSEIRNGCRDQTGELSSEQAAAVLIRAGCSSTVGEQGVQVLYDVVRGDTAVATTYRRSVLGIGGGNHAPGNCQTRIRDPKYADRPAKLGLYMPAGTTSLDVESWCNYSGEMFLLQPDTTNAVFVSLTLDGDDGSISRQQVRYDALLAVRPS